MNSKMIKLKYLNLFQVKNENGSYDDDTISFVELLYHPFACKSIVQKRYQCILINQYIREVKQY